jgi:predicted DNA-binding transcriptional regulator AlpA
VAKKCVAKASAQKRDRPRSAEELKKDFVAELGRELMLDCEVDRVVPLSRTTRWRLRKLNPPQFPQPVKLGRKRVAYRAADIAAVVAGTWRPPAAA